MSDIEIPQQLFDEAAYLNWAIYGNSEIWQELISWADKWIAILDEWPDEITEISLNGRHKESNARACLAVLAQRGSLDAVTLAEEALLSLEQGQSPYQIISRLYTLTCDTISAGGIEFELNVPKPLKTAIYQIDYCVDAVNSIDEESGERMKEAEVWIREEARSHLVTALTEIKSGQT